MKVVVPYWPSVTPDTLAALQDLGIDHRSVRMGHDALAYWRTFLGLWNAGEPFVLVEHDVVLHAEVMPQFTTCPERWCVFPYHRHDARQTFPDLLEASLGCARFRPEGLCKVPPTAWGRLDDAVRLALVDLGWEVCPHSPPVGHVPRPL